MALRKKIITRSILVIFITIPILAIIHYFVFPQETRNILIDYSDFDKEGRLYFKANTDQNKIDSLQLLLRKASDRITTFWGKKTVNPKFIYCDREDDFRKQGSPSIVPALTRFKMGAYIVLSSEGKDLDIISHELAHAEFYQRIGFYCKNFKIPLWFDEGLAMQNDYRDYYSEDTLKARSDNYKNMPDVRLLKTTTQFYNGTYEQVMLNYMTAKHEVRQWYTKEKLDQLIDDLKKGKSFDEAYKK